MLCSARELGLSEDHGGLLELDADAKVGTDLRQALALDDRLFTLKLTPNLAHCLSVFGVAREVAALTGAPLRLAAIVPVKPVHDQTLPVRVEATDLCGRFSGRIVRGVNTRARTPAWMVDRLARCGQRSVSALVDISNYRDVRVRSAFPDADHHPTLAGVYYHAIALVIVGGLVSSTIVTLVFLPATYSLLEDVAAASVARWRWPLRLGRR